ncbi:hypothetical protein CL630_00640 [bacterium]|nr:hypothetical protein [bacterium]|tara:strand:+ start:16142 stop:16579 length:438 start_codon:yes stop_codon:yes gene_type:complete
MKLTQTTKILRKQHEGLLKYTEKIFTFFDVEKLKKEVGQLRILLSQFTKLSNWHLSLEDEILYPALFKHENSELRSTAKMYSEEMGGLKKTFAEYNKKWTNEGSIESNSDEFIKESRIMFDALSARNQKENNELFPMIESLESTS